jgi:hypothetical protein
MHSDPIPSSISHRFARYGLGTLVPLLAAAALTLPSLPADAAGPRTVADVYTATTANMTPSGTNLRLQIIEWQEQEARSEVVATLAAGSEGTTALAKLPTVGYIWPNGSPVGYSVKYAHRAQTADGSTRITLVTDKRLGSYDYKGWSVPTPATTEVPYSVVELYVDGSGNGTGTMSLAANVELDEQAGTVALAGGDTGAKLLSDVKRAAQRP